jgi:uncharacterized SAM-binding protein YcdF (DUF218 family)
MMYAARHLIGALASPLVIALLLTTAGLACKLFGRPVPKRRLFVSAALVAYLGSIPLVGDVLLEPLERRYPALRQDQPLPTVNYVVVLGSGYVPRDEIPVTAALDPDGLARIVEGIRLTRLLSSARLVVSGGAPVGDAPSALGYARLASDLGMPPASLLVSDRALNTFSEVHSVVEFVGNAPFILVTSAYHMPRAMRLMRLAGLNPIPAPTGQRVGGAQRGVWRCLLPGPGGLENTERALHEYLGLAASELRLD